MLHEASVVEAAQTGAPATMSCMATPGEPMECTESRDSPATTGHPLASPCISGADNISNEDLMHAPMLFAGIAEEISEEDQWCRLQQVKECIFIQE